MSTRGNICIKLREEDLDKELPLYDNYHKIIGHIRTNKEFPYMIVYNHHDSYEDKPGLGYRLPRNLKTYMDVRNFILQGNRTSFDDPYTERNEDIQDNLPKFASNVEGEISNEYFYLFEDNRWKVKSWQESLDNKPFRDIEYEEASIMLDERDMEAIRWIIDKYLKIHDIIAGIPEGHHECIMARVRSIEKKIRDTK